MPKNILVAPLDWGLGHTTRCLPLLRHLEALGASLFFAGNQAQQHFICRQMPHLHFLDLPGYEVEYARRGRGFLPKMLLQMPHLLRRVQEEHQWLLQAVVEHKIEGIISDNRYGLWHPTVPNVVLCHQLALHTGIGRLADNAATKFHTIQLAKFGAVWIPDVPASPGLSGRLGHPENLPAGAKFIGLLSQFKKENTIGLPANTNPEKLIILLSGPEPQRSILSDLLWTQLGELNLPAVFIEGKSEAASRTSTSKITWRSLLAGSELQAVLERASYVVCRGGYTTIMDAAALDLKLITIPTPGQGEQHYLGRLLEETNRALYFSQEGFSLKEALVKADAFPFEIMLPAGEERIGFEGVLEDWYKGI